MKNKKTIGIVLSVGLGTFMSSLDSSVVNLAIPMIETHFGVTMSMVEWIVTAYLLIVSSLLLTYGRIADLYGQKRVYTTGFVIFVAGSMLCGLSVNIGMLIGCRVIQALGAGMLFATGPAIITNAVAPEDRGKGLSVTAVAVALGLCAGPVLGGILSTFLGWQSIFYINVPIGLLGIALVWKNIPKDVKSHSVPFDIAGSVIVFFALLLILLPLNLSGDYDISPVIFASLLASGLLLTVFFVWFELRRKNPMLDIRLFQNRVFAASNFAALFTYLSQNIMVFLTPFYLEKLLGYSTLVSGLYYMPLPLATMFTAPISGSASDRTDSRYISSTGALIMAAGLFMLSFLNISSKSYYIVASMIVTGIGFGLFQTPNNSAIMGNVPPENRGSASGTLATMRNIGMAIGVAASGALFSFFQSKGKAVLTTQGQSGVQLANGTFAYALHRTFLIAAAIALVAMAASLAKGKVRTEQEKRQDAEEKTPEEGGRNGGPPA